MQSLRRETGEMKRIALCLLLSIALSLGGRFALANELAGQREVRFTPQQKAFWAFQPVKAMSPPAVKGAAWASPIDRFILARLEAVGVSPAPPADRRVL